MATASLLGGLEHRELVAFRDLVVKTREVVTYCDGITGGGAKVGDTFTNEQCDELTFAKIREHVAVIDKYVNVDLPQDVLESLILLIHNIGETQFSNSMVLAALNTGDLKKACTLFLWYDAEGKPHGFIHSGPYVIKGLINRRRAEQDICLKGLK